MLRDPGLHKPAEHTQDQLAVERLVRPMVYLMH